MSKIGADVSGINHVSARLLVSAPFASLFINKTMKTPTYPFCAGVIDIYISTLKPPC
jgi:hypothetical protein